MKRIEFHAMGSRMLAVVDSPSPIAERALQRVPGWFEQWEQILSRFRHDSELSHLNQSTGWPVVVSQTLWEVFQVARKIEQETNGLVSPTVLNALMNAGYDHSFELLPAVGNSFPMPVLELPDRVEAVALEPATRTLYLPENMHLDFGGLAKGWAAQKAASRLKRYGPAMVDAGGDIAISGKRRGNQAWPIGVHDPFQAESYFETLCLESGGVATSGIDYHRWLQGGLWNHHIIDPRTGLPAATDLLSVTIIAPDTIRAEAAAKVVLIAGSDAGMEWLEAQPDLAGLLVLQSGERLYSGRMENYLWRKL